jgi:hypothetical protein
MVFGRLIDAHTGTTSQTAAIAIISDQTGAVGSIAENIVPT